MADGQTQLPPIEAKGLDGMVFERIREQILHGDLNAGMHLVEADFAAQLGVSHGTVRSGFRLLEEEGLVDYKRGRGVFVTTFSDVDAWEIYTLRNALESMAAGLAAEKIDGNARTALAGVMTRMRDCAGRDDVNGTARADLELHELIVQLAGHRRLELAHRRIHAQTVLFMRLTKGLHQRTTEIVTLHEPLVAAISAGEADTARSLALEHNTTDGEALRALLGSP